MAELVSLVRVASFATKLVPARGNDLRPHSRSARFLYAGERRKWRRYFSVALGRTERPDVRRWLVIVVYRPSKPGSRSRGRVQDPDNLAWGLKPLVDSVVEYGWARDDSDRWMDRTVREIGVRWEARGTAGIVCERAPRTPPPAPKLVTS